MARVLFTFLLSLLLAPPDAAPQPQQAAPAAEQTVSTDLGAADSGAPIQPVLPPSEELKPAVEPLPAAAGDPSKFVLRGRALEIEGGMVAGATVWVSTVAKPAHRLAESVTDTRGYFTFTLPAAEAASELVVKASTPSGLEGVELVYLIPLAEDNPLRVRMRNPAENYDEPNFDAIDDWLLQRMKPTFESKTAPQTGSNPIPAMLGFKRKKLPAWEMAMEILAMLRKENAPETRLLACAALMRLGAWQSAGAVLDGVDDARFKHEKAVLEGVRLNFMRFPEEAAGLLERTLTDDAVDPFVQIELGRAAVLEEDWPGALQRLDPALKNKKLAPHAHYLRARSLFALGDIEAAAQEAKLLTRRVKKKRLPPHVRAFVDDLRERLEEKSIQPVRSVMTQPVSELQKAVPSLARLDSSPPLPGQELAVILKKVGDNIEKFFREFSNTSSLEVIRQSSLDHQGRSHALRRAEMFYVLEQKSSKGKPMLEEIRGEGTGKLQTVGGLEDGFMATTGFAASLVVFHPANQPGIDYRYLGTEEIAGKPVFVVGFAQRPKESAPMGVFRSVSRQAAAQVFVQGLAWISAGQFQILRLRTDLLNPIVEAELTRQTSEIDYRPYRFLSISKTFFLPSRVTVSIEWRKRRLRNEHIFSRFWLFNVDSDSADERRATRTAKIPQPVAAH